MAYIAGIVGRSWVALYKEKNRIRQMLKYERRNDRLRFCHNQQNVLMVNASDVYRLFKRKFSECADIDFPLEEVSAELDGELPCLTGCMDAVAVTLPHDLANAQRLYHECMICKHRLEVERNELLDRVLALDMENAALRKKIPGRPRKAP